MTTAPLVSVVIPCFNAERWVLPTLSSVFAQTWRRLEVVLVDDGSTDGTAGRLAGVSDPRLRVLRQENRGQTAALNRGLADAAGEYVQYLDADDLLHPRKIELQLERLRSEPEGVATCEWARFRSDPAEAVFTPDGTWRDLAPVDWLVEAWKDGGGMLFPALWLAPRTLVDRVGPWREDLTLNNDAEYFTRLLLASRRVLFCAGARAYYRSGVPGSLSGLRSEAGWRSQWSVLEACEAGLLGAEDSPRTRRALSMLWQRYAHACYPQDRRRGNAAMRRARGLHADRLAPEGGRAFRLLRRLAGWRLARRAQAAWYRRRGA